jgi:hypothetical protein
MTDFADITPPASLMALSRAVEANTTTCDQALAKCDNALTWVVKCYELVKPVADGMAAAQENARKARRDSRYAVLAAGFAVFAAFVGLACELSR